MTSIKYIKNTTIFLFLHLLIQCEPVVPQQSTQRKTIQFDDQEYENIVGNVNIVPTKDGTPDFLENPIITLVSDQRLFLDFDLLTEQFENLNFKIYHCNKDWKKSLLRDMEFLNELNNFRITQFDYSQTTIQPYIRYQTYLPMPKISGNFIVVVSRRANPDDILLSRKFMVVQEKASINQSVRMSTIIAKREINHQIEFNLNYGNVLVNSPTKDIAVSILQNHQWHTSIQNIPPTSIQPNNNYLEYRHLDEKTNFNAWNEFRFIDLRTLNVNGRNVGRITSSNGQLDAALGANQSRGEVTYTQNFRDINGNYLIQNSDVGENLLNSDYANVHFFLKEDEVNGKVFVVGRYNNWRMNEGNQMIYDPIKKGYMATIRLKQGYYDYQYYVESSTLPPYFFEGSHFLTEDEYEIFVYYRKPGNVNDEIIGYKKFRSREL
jgi:hypothetical protein